MSVFPTPLTLCSLRKIRDRHSLTSAGAVRDVSLRLENCEAASGLLQRAKGDSPIFVNHGCAAVPAKIGAVPSSATATPSVSPGKKF